MPVKDMYSLVEEARERFKEHGLDKDGSIKATVGYGHIGDGESIVYPRAAEADERVQVTFISILSRTDGILLSSLPSSRGSTRQLVRPLPRLSTYSLTSPPAARNGSISAEHGLGLMKAPYLAYSKSEESIDVMRGVRDLFDPRGILSPYKYLPSKA